MEARDHSQGSDFVKHLTPQSKVASRFPPKAKADSDATPAPSNEARPADEGGPEEGEADMNDLTAKDRLDAENAIRTSRIQVASTIVQVFATIAVITVGVFTIQQITDTEAKSTRQLNLTETGQLSQQFTQAVGQLGGDEATKLGGVYGLGKLARNDPADYGTAVATVLSAFVRNVGYTNQHVSQTSDLSVRKPSVQAALDVLLERPRLTDRQGTLKLSVGLDKSHRLDLRKANFVGDDMVGVNFNGDGLEGANFSGADLSGACLDQATFDKGTTLDGATLAGTNLTTVVGRRSATITTSTKYDVSTTPKGFPPMGTLVPERKGVGDRCPPIANPR
jgi:hypothetical protein